MEYENQLVVEIPVWVCGTQKWVTGLTKRTTCDDVIYALLYNDGRHETESTDKYTVYERWRDVERPLQGRTKILKIWRAWGAEQCNVQLTMRHVDEPGEYGEFLHSRRRRQKRTKRREREARSRLSKSKNEIQTQESETRLKSMEELAKLVINQERRLHYLGSRIENTDKKIYHIESDLHECRMAKDGENYLQDAYLNNGQEDSMTEFFRNVEPENLEMYIQFCERVLELEDQIKGEESKIVDLSDQIQESTFNDAFRADSDIYNHDLSDGNLEAELVSLQAELNRIVSANMMQKYKVVEITKEIDYCDKILHQKQDVIQQLQGELEFLEKGDSDESESKSDKKNQSVDYFHTSTPITEHTVSRTDQSRSRTASKDNHGDYVNIGAIMEWQQEFNCVQDNPSSCKDERRDQGGKKHSFDTEDSFSVDTDNTSNDSQFGNQRDVSKYTNTSFLRLPNTKSLDNDELISERIKKEIYAYKSTSQCNISRSLTSMNGDRTFSCTKSVDDNDSNSDTGLSSMHSDESPNMLETLV